MFFHLLNNHKMVTYKYVNSNSSIIFLGFCVSDIATE